MIASTLHVYGEAENSVSSSSLWEWVSKQPSIPKNFGQVGQKKYMHFFNSPWMMLSMDMSPNASLSLWNIKGTWMTLEQTKELNSFHTNPRVFSMFKFLIKRVFIQVTACLFKSQWFLQKSLMKACTTSVWNDLIYKMSLQETIPTLAKWIFLILSCPSLYLAFLFIVIYADKTKGNIPYRAWRRLNIK